VSQVWIALVACRIAAVGDDTGPPDSVVDSAPTDSASLTDSATGEPVEVRLGGTVTCAEPGRRDSDGPYVETVLSSAWETQHTTAWGATAWVPGETIAVNDLDGDGALDILLGDITGAQLFLGPEFDDDSERIPPPSWLEDGVAWDIGSAAPVDLDDDGDLDLYIGSNTGPDTVYLNDAGWFTESPSSLEYTEIAPTHGAVWADMDGDGDLDAYVSNDRVAGQSAPDPGFPSALLENVSGVLVDVSDRLPEEALNAYTKVATWIDLDGDGTQDLYLNNHQPDYVCNHTLLNPGDGQLSLAAEHPLSVCLSGMGTGIQDINGDRLPDLYLSGWGELVLLESAGDGWYDSAASRGLVPDVAGDQVVGWGTELLDMDNDGLVDAPAGFGPAGLNANDPTIGTDNNPVLQPDGLWMGEADGSFVDRAAEWGVAGVSSGRAFATVDLDGDGFLDLIKSPRNAPAEAWLSRCDDSAWLLVRPRQALPNAWAIGARVTVEVGDQSWTQWVHGGGTSYETHRPQEVHFGLGDIEGVDRLTILWPDGVETQVEDLGVRQVVEVVRGQ